MDASSYCVPLSPGVALLRSLPEGGPGHNDALTALPNQRDGLGRVVYLDLVEIPRPDQGVLVHGGLARVVTDEGHRPGVVYGAKGPIGEISARNDRAVRGKVDLLGIDEAYELQP